ncbi:MAG: hypothetical protein R8G01_12735 [Ilumatobacteraceae bacterium]|nr:hypothetical protein [Ilumatobacteraceae bacterium]
MGSTVGFLHTAALHEPTFRALVAEIGPGTDVVDVVDVMLLEQAGVGGPESPTVVAGVERRLDQLVRAGANRIVCTCSTLGGVAERVGNERGFDVVRVDRAMAERAVGIGGRIVVLAALESTLEPTESLLRDAAAADRSPEMRTHVIAGAWERLVADDLDGYRQFVADAITAVADDVDVIVLAQASMAPAAEVVTVSVPVLSSPRSAVVALLGSGAA